MDHQYYTFQTPQLDCSFFSATEDSTSMYSSSQDDGDRTPRSAGWCSSSSFSGPSTPFYEHEYCSNDTKVNQSWLENTVKPTFTELHVYTEQICFPAVDTWEQPILRSNDVDSKPSSIQPGTGMTTLHFNGDANSLALSSTLAAFSAVSHTDDIFAPLSAGSGMDLSEPSTPVYNQSPSMYHLSSPIDMVDCRDDVWGGRKPMKSGRKCKTGGNPSKGHPGQCLKKSTPVPCPYYTKDGLKCTSKFEREEHFRRHKRTTHRDDCNEEELKAFPIEQCPLWHLDPAGCKEILGNRHDNWCQHMATHVKGGGRNKAVDPSYLVFRMRKQYETDLQEHPEEIVSKLNPKERTYAALWSLWVNGVRERNKTAIKKETKPDLEYMQKLPDYVEYIREVGQRYATEHANRNVWQMLEEEVARYCFDRLLKTGRLDECPAALRLSRPRL